MASTGKETGLKEQKGFMPSNMSVTNIGTGNMGSGRSNGGTATKQKPPLPKRTPKGNPGPNKIANNPATPQQKR